MDFVFNTHKMDFEALLTAVYGLTIYWMLNFAITIITGVAPYETVVTWFDYWSYVVIFQTYLVCVMWYFVLVLYYNNFKKGNDDKRKG